MPKQTIAGSESTYRLDTFSYFAATQLYSWFFNGCRSMLRNVLILAFMGFASGTFAHQQKEAYITLLFNQNSGLLEVSHRFLLHDAEHIFAKLFDTKTLGLSGDLTTDIRTQAAFAAYIETEFALADAEQRLLDLTSVGFESDGKHLWVYQEAPIPETDSLFIKHSALHAFWPKQTNHVNVEVNGETRSVRIQQDDGREWRAIALP